MIYVLGQIAVWMVLAAALGLATGWLVWGWLGPRRPSRTADNAVVRGLRSDLQASRDTNGELEARLTTLQEERDDLTAGAAAATARAEAAERSVNELRGRVSELEAAVRDAEPDDLKQISGVGPKLERMLHRAGVRTFRQLAELSDREVDRLDNQLAEFKGRIRREGWVEQAKVLQASKYSEA